MSGFFRQNLRWLAAAFLLSFASSFGQTFFIALFANDFRAEIGLTHGAFGAIYTGATLASAITMVWLGRTADTVRVQVLGTCVLGALALTALATSQIASAAGLFAVLFALRLFGQGMPSHVASTAMARWFTRARGRALAVTGLGRAAGEGLLPSIAVALVAFIGWRQSWLVVGFVTAAVILPLVMALLAREPHAAGGGEAAGHRGDALASPPREWTRAQVMRDPLFYALLLGAVAPPFILTGVFFHQAHLVAIKGWELADYAAAFPAYALGSVIFSLLTGWAIDRWGAVRLLAVTLVPLAVGLVILAQAAAPSWAFVFMLLAGASNGGSSTLVTALWAELYGTRNIGAIRSIALAVFVGSTAIAPGVTGALIDLGIGIESQILAAAGYTAAVIALFVVMRFTVPRLASRGAAP